MQDITKLVTNSRMGGGIPEKALEWNPYADTGADDDDLDWLASASKDGGKAYTDTEFRLFPWCS
jgi:hypothetical protein